MNDIRIEKAMAWYATNARDIIWRTPKTSAWGILLSEVMSQQTQVSRVEPIWQQWITRWPTPAAFADASKAEVLTAWGSLGYPRRALRLHECAQEIVRRHGGEVPHNLDDLLALPGIGDYTARAVAAFAFGQQVAVIDTNVRRVIARAFQGQFFAPNPSKKELRYLEELLPTDGPTACVSLMELGALVCTNRKPQCPRCPLQANCAWHALGEAEPEPLPAKQAKFQGSDRQVRGKIMQALRQHTHLAPHGVEVLWTNAPQRERALASLLEDGLVELNDAGYYQLPV